MAERRHGEVSAAIAKGAAALGLRQVVATLATVLGGIFLARLLAPEDFGYYAAALLCMALASTVADGGIGASLIRETRAPSDLELRAAFTFQLVVTLGLAVPSGTALLFAGSAGRLPRDAVPVLLLALLVPALASFKVVPTVQLERTLRFGILGAAGAAEVITFNLVSVALAALGMGPTSLGIGMVSAVLVGVAWLGLGQRWHPRLGWDRGALAHHLKFGLPYQGSALLSTLKDSISPLLIGAVAGAASVGYVEWAHRFAAYALLAAFILQRLLLTWFARVKDEPAALDSAVRLALTSLYAVVAPVSVFCLVFASSITRVVFGAQWLPALDVFRLLWVANLFVPAAMVAIAALNAVGRSRTTFSFAVLWMVLTWCFGLPLILALGREGFGWANVAVQLSNFALYVVAARHFRFPWLRTAVVPWAMSVVSVTVGYGLSTLLPGPAPVRLAVVLAVTLTVYGALALSQPGVRTFLRQLRSSQT